MVTETQVTPKQADEILEEIERLAAMIEEDKELLALDPRYSIVAKWIDCNLESVDLS